MNDFLPGMKPQRSLRPSAARTEPAVWIREVMFLKEFNADGVLRRIKLHRGLNVLWAKPSDKDSALFEDGGTPGHAAGKTTFCRLLRWILGEGNFGDDNLRKAVRGKLSKGGVAAEVVVNGAPWLVWREFRTSGRSYSCPGKHLDDLFQPDLHKAPFMDYLAAIAEVVPPTARTITLPASKQAIAWEHVLPWLCRDQECRFSTVLEWREPASESESPSVPAADRAVIARAVLETLAEGEEKLANEHALLRGTHRRESERLPLLTHQAKTDIQRLTDALRQESAASDVEMQHRIAEFERALVADGVELTLAAIIQAYTHKKEALDKQRKKPLVNEELTEAQSKLKKATEARRAAEVSLDEDKRLLEFDRLTLKKLQGELQKDEEERWYALKSAPKGRCNVLLEIAKAEHCPLAKGRNIDFATEKELMTEKEQIEKYEHTISAMAEDLTLRENAVAALKTTELAAHAVFMQALVTNNESLWDDADKEHSYQTILTLARTAEKSQTEAGELPDAISGLDKKLNTSQQALQELRQSQKQAQTNFKAWLEWVVQAVLGNTATVSIEQRVDFMRVTINRSGERNSAAMRTVGVLAFDLAAMLCSCEGQGWHPRLIIHDSPREADLAPDLYRKFFRLAVEEIEAAYGNAEPAFQYIITTTEPPPAQCQQPQWLLDPILDASVPTGRLFGIDL